jgi:hypothetical protein
LIAFIVGAAIFLSNLFALSLHWLLLRRFFLSKLLEANLYIVGLLQILVKLIDLANNPSDRPSNRNDIG